MTFLMLHMFRPSATSRVSDAMPLRNKATPNMGLGCLAFNCLGLKELLLNGAFTDLGLHILALKCKKLTILYLLYQGEYRFHNFLIFCLCQNDGKFQGTRSPNHMFGYPPLICVSILLAHGGTCSIGAFTDLGLQLLALKCKKLTILYLLHQVYCEGWLSKAILLAHGYAKMW